MAARAITAAEIELVHGIAGRLSGRLGDLVEYDDLVGDGLEILVREAPNWDARTDLGIIGQRVRWSLIDEVRRTHGRWFQKRRPLSLDAEIALPNDGDICLLDTITDRRTDLAVQVEARELLDRIRTLSPLWREVMLRRAAGESQGEIGTRLGVSGTRVCQIESRARYELIHGPRPRRRRNMKPPKPSRRS